ncbi:clathrin associated protein complex large subunit [Nowakowskiella sp. JEL0407]|nr:clathrin associated protein complex large subunit [Nowakowskiella sp. JEL0407]
MDFGEINLNKIVSKFNIIRLKDLIKQIRSCKTLAAERAVIQKESAAIRTSFKEENNETRNINVAKLLYIHMLGYNAHFGQMECLKLVASPKFMDKRLGYLGIMMLLDENQEVLTLVTNCLKNDLNSGNMYICGLALCTLGNISSQEMARDLAGEIERLLSSSNSYVRKKAALCTLRIIRKVPELLENFLEKAKNLLHERNHGVLITGITLLTEMCRIDASVTENIRKQAVPTLVRHLKNLVTAGFSPEHDVGGITDPFLQVKILRLMRILGKGDSDASDAMNDVLAQVATNTESSKNVGNAILYETVLTIMDVESENSLRVLGINILGRFLANRDNNIRYVALTTLTRTAQASSSDSSALQRHRSTILDCLRDPDISIRRRALDLSFFLITPQNIRILTRELLTFLEVAESEIKASTASRIVEYAGRYRPNKRWEIDTFVRVLRVSGGWVDQSVINGFSKLIGCAGEQLQRYAVRKLYSLVKQDGEKAESQEGLILCLFWSIGEFGDYLVDGKKFIQDVSGSTDDEEAGVEVEGCTENDVYGIFDGILNGSFATSAIKECAVTAMVKLTGKFSSADVVQKMKTIIQKYQTNIDVELQQRAIEFTQLFTLDYDTRVALLERMPVLDSAVKEEALKDANLAAAVASSSGSTEPSATSDLLGGGTKQDDIYNIVFGSEKKSEPKKSENIIDLLGDIGIGSTNVASNTSTTAIMSPISSTTSAAAKKPQRATDLLGDLFGSGPALTPASTMMTSPPISMSTTTTMMSSTITTTTTTSATNYGGLDDLLGLGGSTSPSSTPTVDELQVYEKNGLKITMSPKREDGTNNIIVNTKFRNVGFDGGEIKNLSMQVAVPKTLKLQLQPPSSTVVPKGGTSTQMFKIDNSAKMYRVEFAIQNSSDPNSNVKETIESALSNFPSDSISSVKFSDEDAVSLVTSLSPLLLLNSFRKQNLTCVFRGASTLNSKSPTTTTAAVCIFEAFKGLNPNQWAQLDNRGLARLVQVSEEEILVDITLTFPRGLNSTFTPALSVNVHEFGDISNGAESTGSAILNLGTIESNSSHSHRDVEYVGIVKGKVWEVIGRSIVVAPIAGSDDNGKDLYVCCGVVARSAGMFENTKKVCSCSGKTLWEEEFVSGETLANSAKL